MINIKIYSTGMKVCRKIVVNYAKHVWQTLNHLQLK